MPKQTILNMLPFLSPTDRQDILSFLSDKVFEDNFVLLSTQIQEQRYANGYLECPFCQTHHVVKNGNVRGSNAIFVVTVKSLFVPKHKQLQPIQKSHLMSG